MIDLTVSHRAVIVRSAFARSSALSFEKAFSIDGVDGSCSWLPRGNQDDSACS